MPLLPYSSSRFSGTLTCCMWSVIDVLDVRKLRGGLSCTVNVRIIRDYQDLLESHVSGVFP